MVSEDGEPVQTGDADGMGGGMRGVRNSLAQDRYRERKHSESKEQRRRLCCMDVGLRGAEWKDGRGAREVP